MLAALWIKVRFYVFTSLGVLAAIVAGIGYGWLKGREHAAGKVRKATQRAADATATTKAYRSRAKVDAKVRQTPNKGPQRVGGAAPDTAAGKLRRWIRK